MLNKFEFRIQEMSYQGKDESKSFVLEFFKEEIAAHIPKCLEQNMQSSVSKLMESYKNDI
jgi:hypothetical protein